MPIQIGQTSASFSNPTALLSDCHRRIESFLRTLSAIAGLNGRVLSPPEAQALENALGYFHNAAPKHTADEEESLFPRLRGLDNQALKTALTHLDRLEADHEHVAPLHEGVQVLGRQWIAEGQLSPEGALRFASLVENLQQIYREHIKVEDDLVFPAAASLLSDEAKSQIGKEMAERRSGNPLAGNPRS